MSFLVSYLKIGIGLEWATAAVLTALILMQLAGALAVRLHNPAALAWANGAMFTLLFAVEGLTRHNVLAGDRVLSHEIAWGVIVESVLVCILLVWQMRRLVPSGTRTEAFKRAF
jgi:hypothetical protein